MQNDKYLAPEHATSAPPTHDYNSPQPGPSQNNPPQGYPQPGYPQPGYPPAQGYPQTGYPPSQGYPQTGYPPSQGYPQTGYPPAQGYPQTGYPPQNFAPPPQNYAPPPQSYMPPPSQNYGPPPPQNYGPPPTQPLPPTTVIVQPNGWYNRNLMNKPQSNAVGAAALIFISGGMNIAWSMGFRTIYYFALPLHTRVAWFIGAIIGAFFSCFLANKLPKKIVLCFSSLLVIIGGIIMASTHWDTQVLEASLYLDGIANGLAFAPAMALAGEVAVSYMRGPITASIEQMAVMTGIFIQTVFLTSWNTSYQSLYDFNQQQMQGILSVVCGVIALIIAALLCIESPVIMLANGEEQQAIDALRLLQRPYTLTTETYAQLEEHKRYLAQNKDLSNAQSISQAMLPFIKLCCLRGLNVMSLSTFVFYALLISVFPNNVYTFGYIWQYLLFGVIRWMGTFITSFCMESVGRKKPTLMGLLVSGSFAFGIAKTLNDIPYTDFDSIFWLLCVFQFFAGIAFTSTSSYMSEAYPLGVKQHFIGSTYIVEMLLFIFIASMDYTIEGHVIYFYALGGLSVVGSIIGIFCLPETRRTTLRESQDKFRGLLSTGF